MEREIKTYTVEDIQNMLGIGRSRAYTFISEVYKKKGPFRVLRIGNLYKIPKEPFDAWLNGS